MSVLGAGPVGAQAADSLPAARREPLFSRRDALTLGGLALASVAVSTLDRRIARGLQKPTVQDNSSLGGVARSAKLVNERSLFAIEMGTWAVSRLTHADRPADIALHAAEAVFVSSAAATVVRGVLGRSRPFITNDGDPYDFHAGKGFGGLAYRAYPSIHASASMATAVVVTRELRRDHPEAARIVGPLLYAGALLPGAARMYADKHWASDVAMGLGLGWWTGQKVVRDHHSRDRTKLDRWMLGASGDGGVVVTLRF